MVYYINIFTLVSLRRDMALQSETYITAFIIILTTHYKILFEVTIYIDFIELYYAALFHIAH